MYAVVGCNNCGTYWILSDPGKSAQCPRCRKRHQVRKLRKFIETDQRDAARQTRAALLAKKRGESETFADLDSVAEMGRQVEESGIDDEEYLEGSGLDAEAVAAAGDAPGVGAGSGSSRSRREVVEDALREGDRPTEAEVVEYATEHGVPEDAAADLLERLTRRGEVSESRGRYRLL